jgi:DNA topoisomerase-3
MTAQLECLLDDVVVGKQAMVGAIDAVCDVAQRIIGKLTQGPVAGGSPLLSSARDGGNKARPPTSAMKRYADSIARQKRIRPPPGYATSLSICRAFLEQHAPRKAGSRHAADSGSTVASLAQVTSGVSDRPARKRRQGAGMTAGGPAHRKAARGRKTGKPKLNGQVANASPRLAGRDVGGNTRLKIPYGNKEVALKLGARYDAGGWYAPPGVDLSAFREKDWL